MVTIEDLQKELSKFRIFLEVLPYKGSIDFDKMEIEVNPAFCIEEILAHEILHSMFPNEEENVIIELSRWLVTFEEVKEFLRNWCFYYSHKRRTSNLFSLI